MQRNIKIYEEMEQTDERRFYPSNYPISVNEPLKTNFMILESPEEIRKGLISLVSFFNGDLISQCMGVTLTYQTLYSLQYKKGLYFHDSYFAGYLLHSCSPNAKLDMVNFTLHAIKDIKPFEMITIDYEMTEDRLYQGFDCTCGSENCKGWVIGRKAK